MLHILPTGVFKRSLMRLPYPDQFTNFSLPVHSICVIHWLSCCML